MQNPINLITHAKDLKSLVKNLSTESLLAIDTEFIREHTYYPQLALIQVASQHNVWLIDPLALNDQDMEPFLELLQNPKILKVLHSAYGDQECFYTAYGLTATPTLDTFEAASLIGYGESISLDRLIEKVLKEKIPKHFTRTHWLKRPLSQELLGYAAADVRYLVSVAQTLLQQLDAKNRKAWALEISAQFENPKLYQNPPQAMAYRIAKSGRVNFKRYPIFEALVEWRENRAQTANIPRRRIADDETLINIANSCPKAIEQLTKFRGLNKGEIQREGAKLINLIQNNKTKDSTGFSIPPKPPRPTPEQSRVIDFLSTCLKSICQKHQIASRLVMTVKDLQKIVTQNLLTPEQWLQEKVCSPQASELVAEAILDILKGKKALAVKNNQLEFFDL